MSIARLCAFVWGALGPKDVPKTVAPAWARCQLVGAWRPCFAVTALLGVDPEADGHPLYMYVVAHGMVVSSDGASRRSGHGSLR